VTAVGAAPAAKDYNQGTVIKASSLLLFVVGASLVMAQQPAAESRDWTLETSVQSDPGGHPFYSPVAERGGDTVSIFHHPQWQPGWDRTDKSRLQATALKLAYRLEGDAVHVEAFVVLGPFEEMDTPRSLEGVPQESAGKFLLRLGESATVGDLARYGLEPLTVRVVQNKPLVPGVPEIINNTAAIRVEGVDQDRTFYKLAVRNVSSKNITDVVVNMPDEGGGSRMSESASPKHPLIAAGALHQLMLGFSEPAVVRQIVIAAAVFDDGSFEGSAEAAAGLEAQRLGSTVQGRRVIALVQRILDHGDGDDGAMASAIRSQAAALPEEVEPSVVESLMARYPDLPSTAKASIHNSIHIGLHQGKESLAFSLKEFERYPRPGNTLRTWWENQRAAMEDR
jgi:hypothetical protein